MNHSNLFHFCFIALFSRCSRKRGLGTNHMIKFCMIDRIHSLILITKYQVIRSNRSGITAVYYIFGVLPFFLAVVDEEDWKLAM